MTEEDGSVLYRKCVSAQSHWPSVGPDPFSGIDQRLQLPHGMGGQGPVQAASETERMLVLAPHLNHRFTDQTSAARFMWMEAHLKKSFRFPKVSPAELVLDTENGVPLFRVQVDQASGLRCEEVEIHYGYARDPAFVSWRSRGPKVRKVYEGGMSGVRQCGTALRLCQRHL